MGWEWRVFYPAPGVDVWELLKARPRSDSPERRTDLYLACSAGAGVKLRSQKTLEVKLRTASHRCGAEQWGKVLHTRLKWDGRDTKALGVIASDAISRQREWIVRRAAHPSDCLQRLEEVVALREADKIDVFDLNKSRVSSCVHGVAIEQTDITIDGQAGAVWRSVCIEGTVMEIMGILAQKAGRHATVGERLLENALGGAACGYPEFIVRLQQRPEQE